MTMRTYELTVEWKQPAWADECEPDIDVIEINATSPRAAIAYYTQERLTDIGRARLASVEAKLAK